MKSQFNKVPSAAFAIAFLSVICTSLCAEEADTWTTVSRMNQIAGNWEGMTAFDIPASEEAMMPAGSMDVTISFCYAEGADEIEFKLKMDFSRYVADWSRYIGLSPGTLWEVTSLMLRKDKDIGAVLEIGEYFIYYSQTFPVDEMLVNGSALINADGNKLRFDESSQPEIGNFPISGFVMYRK
jgi:hypothetical protein